MEKEKEKNIIREILEFIGIFLLAVVIALYIKGNIFFISNVEGPSMEPNFYSGDKIVASKISYWFKDPIKEDIVVVDTSKDKDGQIYNIFHEALIMKDTIKYKLDENYIMTGTILLKRVIALPGDTIDIKGGLVYVNGEAIEEDYAQGYTDERGLYDYPMEVPEGKVFVMGDNRERSSDSRDLGLMEDYQIKGKVVHKFGGNK